jgi:hypothetical protein
MTKSKGEKEVAAVTPVDRWQGDHFGRQKDSILLQQFLKARVAERKQRNSSRSYVVNIDAAWGQGKSFFMERFKGDLDVEHSVVYVNAWQDDHAEDPLIAIMVAVEAALIPKKGKASKTLDAVVSASGKLAITLGKHGLMGLARRAIGQDGIDAALKTVEQEGAAQIERSTEDAVTELIGKCADAALREFEITKATIEDFKQKLGELVASNTVRRPLFVLIDELDRCRPSYAVSLLERIKHLFDVPDVVFVIATDTEQLRHAVTAVYGVEFDGRGYLLRFFDRTYRFTRPDTQQFITAQFEYFNLPVHLLSSPPEDNHAAYFAGVARGFDLSPREIERAFDVLRSAITMWPYGDRQARIELSYLLPLIVAHVRADHELFDSLAKCDATILQKQWAPSNVVFQVRDTHNRQYSRADHSYRSMGLAEGTTKLLESAKRKIHDIVSVERHPEGAAGWAYERFVEEMQRIHNGKPMTFLGGRTVLWQYPELVRAVGQLTPKE